MLAIQQQSDNEEKLNGDSIVLFWDSACFEHSIQGDKRRKHGMKNNECTFSRGGRVDRASSTVMVYSRSIPGRVKLKL